MQKIRRIPLTPTVYIGIILKYVRGFYLKIETFMVPGDFFRPQAVTDMTNFVGKHRKSCLLWSVLW